jgi:predicted DNA binding CopG/RHH family protein
MHLPASFMEAVKARAAERGIPYQRRIREAIEGAVRR